MAWAEGREGAAHRGAGAAERALAPVGAIELDQDYRAAVANVGDARWRLAAILALALLALIVALLPILRRVTDRLEAYDRGFREAAARRERLLDAERAARAEAESVQRLPVEQNERLRGVDGVKDESRSGGPGTSPVQRSKSVAPEDQRAVPRSDPTLPASTPPSSKT